MKSIMVQSSYQRRLRRAQFLVTAMIGCAVLAQKKDLSEERKQEELTKIQELGFELVKVLNDLAY